MARGAQAGDGDPLERMVCRRGRKRVCCVEPCSRSLRGMAGRRGQKNREGERNTLAPLTRVWYFLFLFSHEAQIITETHVTVLIVAHCEHCCAVSLCSVWGGHGFPERPPPHVPASLPAHCSPSSLNLLPFCHCFLPSTHTPLVFMAIQGVCPTLMRCPPILTLSFAARRIQQEHAKLCGPSNEGRHGGQKPHMAPLAV